MINSKQIQSMVESKSYWRLVRRILANGRCSSPSARERLEHPAAAAPAALGLALQRLCELTYGPCEAAAEMARKLLAIQRSDGLFGTAATPSAAASAVALRGLLAWEQLCRPELGAGGCLGAALGRGMEALAAVVESAESPEGHQRPAPDPIEVEIIIWQLGSVPSFRQMAPANILATLSAVLPPNTPADDLARFAHAAAA